MDPDQIVRRYLMQQDVGSYRFSKDTLILKLSQLIDYSAIELEETTDAARVRVKEEARRIYGEQWNFYSGALRREVLRSFQLSIWAARPGPSGKLNYLEIGSSQGLSMGVIGSILKSRSLAGALTSVDPYFEGGYLEGNNGPWAYPFHIQLDKTSRDRALELYRALQLDVELIEDTSRRALIDLIRRNATYELIYIDGSHERLNPVIDFGLCTAVAAPGAVIMLDDHYWPDVAPLRELCERHCSLVAECWKVAAYRLPAE